MTLSPYHSPSGLPDPEHANTQNRDALAMHLKLDALIRSIQTADNDVIRAEDETLEELERLKTDYERLYTAHNELKSTLKQVPLIETGGRDAELERSSRLSNNSNQA